MAGTGQGGIAATGPTQGAGGVIVSPGAVLAVKDLIRAQE